LATACAACIPAPLEDPALVLGTDSAVILSVSITTKNGQRPNLGSTGASMPDEPAVTHIFIKCLSIFLKQLCQNATLYLKITQVYAYALLWSFDEF
jgi:hypothetical protein